MGKRARSDGAVRAGLVTTLLPVALGGALGACARYLTGLAMIGLWPPGTLPLGLPLGTFAVNVIGSFIIGLVAALMLRDGRFGATPARRQFLIAGFCGGFTTFSIFSLEVLHFLETGAFARAGAYAGLSLVCWLLAVALGMHLGRLIVSRS